MRKFSDTEKVIIVSIVTQYDINPVQYVLVNAYNDIFYRRRVMFDADKGNYLFFYRKVDTIDLQNDLFPIINQILEISLLIKYLVVNDLIYLIDTQSINDLKVIKGFQEDKDEEPVRVKIDSNVADILLDSMNHRIFVSETLRALISDNFETVEEKILATNQKLSLETIELNKSTSEQKRELKDQTRYTIELYRKAEDQTYEAKRLADEAEAQTSEAVKQTIAAEKQAREAIEQTKIAKKQTYLSYGALALSIVAIICSYLVARFVTMDVKLVKDQYNSVNTNLNKIVSNMDSLKNNNTGRVVTKKQICSPLKE